MIVVRIELWPLGDESRKREIGVAHIVNDGRGTPQTGDYDIRLLKSPEYAKTSGIWRRGKVAGFPRKRLGPWDLLFRALVATVAGRNKVDAAAASDATTEVVTDPEQSNLFTETEGDTPR